MKNVSYRPIASTMLAGLLTVGCGGDGAPTQGELGTQAEALTPLISCPLLATCYAVTNTSDGGAGSLRQAIIDANAASGQRIIKFNIDGLGPHTISPLTALPTLNGSIKIDGFSQPNAAEASDGTMPRIEIVISGLLATSTWAGLDLDGGDNVVQGLAINDFQPGGAVRALSRGNVVRGNLLGVDPAGNARPNDYGVLILSGGSNTLLGGPNISDRNVISGNRYDGVFIMGPDNEVYGNAIGTDFGGTVAIGNGGSGIGLAQDGNQIGGTSEGEVNTIAWNASDGITGWLGLENTLSRNSVHDNGGLGIDLEADGVTANDGLLDPDSGANGLQNFPELNGATLDPATEFTGKYKAAVDWQLASEANTKYRIEFFASAACDPSGHGEGERFLGSRAINTNVTGFVQNLWVLPGRVAPGEVITATATKFVRIGDDYVAKDTSEFSACLPAVLCTGNTCGRGNDRLPSE